jgi:hypothetical protein
VGNFFILLVEKIRILKIKFVYLSMELRELKDYKISKGFEKILSLENREGHLQIIEKLTRTKIIVKNNIVLIIW